LSTHCRRHVEELAAGRCRTCQHGYCVRCLVYAFGPSKPPYCVNCAIHAAGVRTRGMPARALAVPTAGLVGDGDPGGPGPVAPMDKRTERAYRRAEKAAAKAAARAARKASVPDGAALAEAIRPQADPTSSQVPAPSLLRAVQSATHRRGDGD